MVPSCLIVSNNISYRYCFMRCVWDIIASYQTGTTVYTRCVWGFIGYYQTWLEQAWFVRYVWDTIGYYQILLEEYDAWCVTIGYSQISWEHMINEMCMKYYWTPSDMTGTYMLWDFEILLDTIVFQWIMYGLWYIIGLYQVLLEHVWFMRCVWDIGYHQVCSKHIYVRSTIGYDRNTYDVWDVVRDGVVDTSGMYDVWDMMRTNLIDEMCMIYLGYSQIFGMWMRYYWILSDMIGTYRRRWVV